MFVSSFIALVVLLQTIHAAELLGVKNYCDQIATHLVNHIENGEITGNAMPILDFENKLQLEAKGLNLSGSMFYHSAFISKIRSVGFSGQSGSVSKDVCFVSFLFQLIGVSIVYDIRFQLEDYKGPATMEINFPLIQFEINIVREHNSEKKDGRLMFMGSGGSQYDTVTRIHPANGYTVLCIKETRRNYNLREGMMNSLKKWSDTLKPVLTKAIGEIPFPIIQYA